MKFPLRGVIAAAGAACAVLATGCGGSSSDATKNVTVKFAAVAGDEMVRCDHAVTGLGATKATASVQDLRLYISDVKLLRDGAEPVALKLGANDAHNFSSTDGAVTMLDFENGGGKCKEDGDATTNTQVAGTVPAGDYTGVEFTVGVPEALNHSDPTAVAAPLNLTAMSWDWQAGRKFTKIELVDPMDGGARWAGKAFMIHLGSTGCTGNPAAGETATCIHPNRAKVVLTALNLDKDTIALDLAKLVEGIDITTNAKGAPGCMSAPDDPECGGIFGNLKIDWKADGTGTGQVVGDGSAQRVFRVMR